jgi:RNA polymerase sigma-70 factor, ECF subfamily
VQDDARRKQFDEQFVRSHRHVFRFVAALVANADDAEEVFQETCLVLLEKWRDFDPERPMVPWACGIARNVVRRFFERNRRRGLSLSEAAIDAVYETQQRMPLEVDLRLQKLPDCLGKLSDDQRSLLEQSYSQQTSIRAIAEARQLDPNAVYKRLERIRRTLFECIELAMNKEKRP